MVSGVYFVPVYLVLIFSPASRFGRPFVALLRTARHLGNIQETTIELNWLSCRGRKSLMVGWFVCWQVGGDQIWAKRIVLGEENCGRNTRWEAEAAIRVIWAWAGRGPSGRSNGAKAGKQWGGRTGRGLKGCVCCDSRVASGNTPSSWAEVVEYCYSRVPSFMAPAHPRSSQHFYPLAPFIDMEEDRLDDDSDEVCLGTVGRMVMRWPSFDPCDVEVKWFVQDQWTDWWPHYVSLLCWKLPARIASTSLPPRPLPIS